ncbi:MAG: fumarate hydratase [Candidatus Omnitrophica bacterium]|nr:fumarate hydratase [Candidatus Omnitrophota bacterium]
MKEISADKISKTVADLCIQANFVLRADVLSRLKTASHKETSPRARDILKATLRNSALAQRERLAICQDTGLPCVFVEIGQEVVIKGDLKSAINQGIEAGYREGYLRASVIQDPLSRGNPGYSPAIIHIDLVKGRELSLTVLPKGFGCENKTQLRMFKPTTEIEEIKKFIIDAVKAAGPDACPPYVLGVGIGGSADYACLLAKKALLRNILQRSQSKAYRLERELLKEINKLCIGPMGLGGKTTALAVNIETFPTHIAGLPVAVNVSCHALRSATKKI